MLVTQYCVKGIFEVKSLIDFRLFLSLNYVSSISEL